MTITYAVHHAHGGTTTVVDTGGLVAGNLYDVVHYVWAHDEVIVHLKD